MLSMIKKVQESPADPILAELEAVRARLAALDRTRELRARTEDLGDNTPASDALDAVQIALDKEEEFSKRESLLQRLRELTQAEERIRQGTYGLCEECGDPIPPARLRALPRTRLCVPCAETAERREAVGRVRQRITRNEPLFSDLAA